MIVVSFIVPVYKVEKYLKRCVDSILSQTYRQLEIILVDDGSPDSCPQICDEYAKTDERVRVIHRKNGGLSAARNSGLEIATGKYVIFVDSDDYIEPQMAREMVDFCEKNDLDLAMGHIYKAEKRINTALTEPYAVYQSEELLSLWHSIYTHIETQAWGKIYKRELFDVPGLEPVRYPEGKLFEDVMTTHLLVARAKRVGILYAAYYHYTYNPEGIMHMKYTRKRFEDTIAVQRARTAFFRDHCSQYPQAYERMKVFLYKSIALNYCMAIRAGLTELQPDLDTLYGDFKTHYPELKGSPAAGLVDRAVFFCLRWMPGVCVNLLLPVYQRLLK